MALNVKQSSQNRIEIVSFPICFFSMVVLLLLYFWSYAVFFDNQLKLADYLIFNFVCIVVLCIPQYRHTIIDKKSGCCELFYQRLGMKKTQRIALNQIKDVLVIKGKGQYMGSHCLYLITDTNKYAVADSDIIPGSKGRVKSIRDELSNWIRL